MVPPRQPPSGGRGLTRGSRAACGLLQEGGKEFIGTLVAIHKHFVMMFDECCDCDKDLHTVLKQAYARALGRSPAPLTSPHCVGSPRKGAELCLLSNR